MAEDSGLGGREECAVWGYLAGPVPTGGAVGDAVRCKVEVMEDDLLTLDAQLPDTAWGVGRQDEPSQGCWEACPAPTHALQCPPRCSASQVRSGQG